MAITLSTDGYCEATDVAALLQNLTISTTSKPTTAQVETMITEDFGEINAMLVAANIVAPVAQAGGSLTASPGTIAIKSAEVIGVSSVVLEGSGGTLVGVAKEDDFIVITGDAQRYYFTEDRLTDGGEVTVLIRPALELALSGGEAVTYTAAVGAANIVKKLNSLMTAIRTARAAYGTDADVGAMPEERDRLMKNIETHKVHLPGADEVEVGASGIARLMRA